MGLLSISSLIQHLAKWIVLHKSTSHIQIVASITDVSMVNHWSSHVNLAQFGTMTTRFVTGLMLLRLPIANIYVEGHKKVYMIDTQMDQRISFINILSKFLI